VHTPGVAVVDNAERLGVGPRLPQQLGVAFLFHAVSLPSDPALLYLY
jgi:hypothetical protein